MKKVFKFLMMVLLVLFVGAGTMWGQIIDPSALQDPGNWFYVELRAQVSTVNCGMDPDPGEVRLTFTDISNDPTPIDPWITYNLAPVNPYDEENEPTEYNFWAEGFDAGLEARKNGDARDSYPDYYCKDNDPAKGFADERGEGWLAGWDWYDDGQYLNDNNPSEWGADAALYGYSLIHADGIEIPGIVSTYAYFRGEAREHDGWYFAGWSFVDGDYDLGGTVEESTLFKIFPEDTPGFNEMTSQSVYATFKPIMVAGYTVNGTIDVVPGTGNSGNNTIVFDVQGERINSEDFSVSVDGDYYEHGTCTPVITSVADGKVTVMVTYETTDADAGMYRCNVTFSSKSGCSELTAPVFVRVAETSSEQASLYNEKVSPDKLEKSGNLATLLSEATATQIVALNKNYTAALSIDNDVTFDLNGYNITNTVTVTDGNVTLAYSKFGGSITNTVTVQSGATLTLNGGTIVVENGKAVDVKSGGTLIQNGATIRSAASASNTALGIAAGGTVTFNDGSVDAQATSNKATAVLIEATGKLIANGGTMSATTNGNAYAVDVTASAGEAQINGGIFNAVSTANKAVGLATSGKMTIGKHAIVSAHTENTATMAYAVNVLGGADVTIDGGRFSATHVENETVVTHAPINVEEYTSYTFNAGYIKTDRVYLNEGITEPKLYNLTYKGTDYMDGYRYLAVREGLDAKAYGMQAARIGTTGYTSIVDALEYANNNRDKTVVIVLQNDDEMPAGYYTLPWAATLIIPMKYDQETDYPTIPRIASTHAITEDYEQPTPYVTLTMADGVNFDVHGWIEVSGTQRSSDESYASLPSGPCGFINMQEGSRMTMQAGSLLRAWGFIIGKGETDVRRDATVFEQFQMGDWKGGSTSFGMLSRPEHVFPLTHYYIQNIESPFKYHPGAILSTTTAVSATLGGIPVTASANDIKVVGVSGRDQAMFLMDNEADADNTWVRKWYDVENDLQVYDVNNSAHIGSMVLDLGKLGSTPLEMNSGYFVLPITCNMKIHLLSGTMDFTQNTSLLPGAEVEIDKESMVTIIKNSDPSVLSGSLYIYSAQQWDKYAYDEAINGGSKYTKPVKYAAGFGGQPTARAVQYSDLSKLKDATINVHGSFAINYAECYLLTSEGGANIFSTNEDAGTYVFGVNGPAADYSEEVWQVKNRSTYQSCMFTPAQLKNGAGAAQAYAQTANRSAGESYCYMGNQWTIMEVDSDDECFMVDNYGTFYAKPADYVAVVGTKVYDSENDVNKIVGNEDHTYSDKAGTGRLFILMDQECQWWEVENVDNLYHCIHPNNDTYYYWDENREVDDEPNPGWVEKKFTITWKDWDGTIIQTVDKEGDYVDNYEVTYGTMAEFLGTNPVRDPDNYDLDYTYDFTGWTPALGPVTSDVTYTATYNKKDRKYTIIFRQEGRVEIERHFLKHNEMPVCEKTPTKPGHILQWEPAIAAVTADAEYTATWLEEPPTEYEITFYDYDGEILQQANVELGQMPAYTEPTPSRKPATDEYEYEFDHWSPALEEVSHTSVKTYTAVYREVEVTYTISYFMEDGETPNPTKAFEKLPWGATPTPPAVTKENPAEGHTYTLLWKNVDDGSNIQTVMGAASYYPTYTDVLNKYTVTLLSATSGACTFTGAGVYEYGATANIRAIPASGYEFVEWQETHSTEANLGAQTVTGNITLTAVLVSASPANLEIAEDASVTLDVPVTYEDLIITSDGVHSGELINANYLTLTGEANFDLAINAQANTWYAIAVPWQVEVSNGITVNGVRQQANSDFYMAYYDGSIRAAQGKVDACWKYMTSSSIMQPGVLYMLYMTHAASTIRFRKKADAALLTTTLSVQAHPQSTSNEADAGWNGIANPALFHGYLNPSASTYSHPNFGQKYNPSTEQYDAIDMSQAANELIVGAPVFVQVAADKNFSIYDNWSDAAAHVPTRRAKVDNSYYEVQISSGEEYTDRIYLFTQEDKEDRYVIGLDLAKAGTSTKVAQMWVDRYNTKLCVNTTAPIGKTATYPLGISVPQEGEYYIYPATDLASNQEMYVTYDGRAIWNLAYGPYMVNLPAGTHTQYGLKLIQRESPAVTTDVEQITNDQSQIQKVLIDNTIYIIREGAVYTINGQKVK